MALKKFARRDVILPAAVFLLTFAAALFSLRLLSLNQEKDERLRAVYVAESTISRVSSQLNRYLAESDFIKKYIESGHVLREEEFAGISGNMQDGSRVIKTHELAKDGVVSQVYPVAGNEAAIGLDVLHNPARKKEANLARNSGMYTIAGPFELVQGGTGALLFDPIYTDSKKGERSFWGFSILVLQWDNFMEEVELDKMEEAGYRYQIWKKDPYTGEKIVIAESEEDFPGNALEVACSVPNDTWYFEIIPKAGWFSNQQLSLSIAIAAIIGMMLAYACWELMNRHRKDLQHEAALEKSAQEARAANEAKTRFLFNMSHDIRTPMNAIIGFSELLEKHIDEKDKVLDYTEKIRSSSAFLLSLINLCAGNGPHRERQGCAERRNRRPVCADADALGRLRALCPAEKADLHLPYGCRTSLYCERPHQSAGDIAECHQQRHQVYARGRTDCGVGERTAG